MDAPSAARDFSELALLFGSPHPERPARPEPRDMAALAGVPGIGVTWTGADGDTFLAAVLAAPVGGQVGIHARLDSGLSFREAVAAALAREAQEPGLFLQHVAIATALPTEQDPGVLGEAVEVRRAWALEASAGLPPWMARGCRAVLEAGLPRNGTIPILLPATPGAVAWDVVDFACRHPLLVPLLSESRLRDAFSGGMAVRDALRVMCPGFGEGHLRRLRGASVLDGTALAHLGFDSAPGALEVILSLPPDWIPAPGDAGQWEPLAALANACNTVAGFARVGPSSLLMSTKGDWRAAYARCRGRGPLERDEGVLPQSLSYAASDVRDMCDALAKALARPLLLLSDRSLVPSPDGGYLRGGHLRLLLASHRLAATLAFGDKGLPAIMAASRSWHARRAAIESACFPLPEGPGETWPALMPDTSLPGGIRVTFLSSQRALAEEGSDGPGADGTDGLDHCVLSRLPRFVSGEAHVASVRGPLPDGRMGRLSTAEVKVVAGRPVVTEHRGKGNAPPPAEAVAAMAAVLAACVAGTVPVNPLALEPRPAPASRPDVPDPADVERAARAWAPFLPRWLRGLDAAGMLAALGGRGLLSRSTPD